MFFSENKPQTLSFSVFVFQVSNWSAFKSQELATVCIPWCPFCSISMGKNKLPCSKFAKSTRLSCWQNYGLFVTWNWRKRILHKTNSPSGKWSILSPLAPCGDFYGWHFFFHTSNRRFIFKQQTPPYNIRPLANLRTKKIENPVEVCDRTPKLNTPWKCEVDLHAVDSSRCWKALPSIFCYM